MLLDPQVRSSLVTFVNAVLADGLHVRPAVEDKDDPDYGEAKELAEFGEHCLEYPERPVDLCVTDQLYAAAGHGNQLAEVVTEPGSGRWGGWDVLGKYKPLPRHAYALVVNGFGTLVGARVLKPGEAALPWQGPAAAADLGDVLPLEKFTLLAWMPEAGDPRGTNLLDPVYRPWWHKRMTQEDSVKFIARFGQPWVFVTPPEGAQATTPADALGNPTGDPIQSAVDQYVAKATEMYSGGVFGGIHGTTFQLVTSTSEGRAFWTKIEACNREITLGILGSTRLTMEAQHGSKADSQTAQDVAGLRVKYAKRLVSVALNGLLYNLVKWNRGKAVADRLAPRVTLSPTEQQDWSARATAAAAVGYRLDPSQLPGVDEELGMPPRAPAPVTQTPDALGALPDATAGTPAPPPGRTPLPTVPAPAAQFSAGDDDCHWVTLGGKAGEGGERKGGSPVCIKDGRIAKGAPSLTGKRIDALHAPAEEVSHRTAMRQSREYARAVHAKNARKEGIEPAHLHQLAAEMVAHDKELTAGRAHVLREARRYSKTLGEDLQTLKARAARGIDEDALRHLDDVAQSMAYQYPEHFAGHQDAQTRLFDMLAEGTPTPMSEDEAYKQALEHLREHKPEPKPRRGRKQPLEDAPFSREGDAT